MISYKIIFFALRIIKLYKFLCEEKFNFLFSAYNSLTIIVSHILPFNLQGETTIIVLFILWVLFWNIVPLICRLISRKHEEKDIELLAKTQGKTVAQIKDIIASLQEFNPMMGHRGCRLAVTYPEIAAMQTRAVMQAAINVQKKHADWKVVPEIMIPLVGEVKELKILSKCVNTLFKRFNLRASPVSEVV